jgi:hypothetical protein
LALNSISESVKTIRAQIAELRPGLPVGGLKTHVEALSETLQTLAGATGGGPGGGAGVPVATVATTTGRLRTLFNLMERVDLAPTPQAAAAVPDIVKDSQSLQEKWQAIKSQNIPALNQELRAAGLTVLGLPDDKTRR